MKQLLDAGVHFGHQTRRWNPKMKRFIHGERSGIHIIDLRQTLGQIENSYGFVRDTIAKGGSILFVGTKKQAQESIQSYADRCNMPYVNQRWLGGMLTNFETISKRVNKMREYERMIATGEFDAMPKKEALLKNRELVKLQRNLGGIKNMTKVPDAIFILDTRKEHIAVTEANKLGIPIIAVVDTNCDPDLIQYVIPGNDDAIRSGEVMTRIMSDAVIEGRFIHSRRNPNAAAAAPAERSPEDEARIAREQALAQAAAAEAAAAREARVQENIAAAAAAPAEEAPAEAAAEAPAEAAAEAPAEAPAEAAPEAPAAEAAAAETPEETPMSDFTAKDVKALRDATGAGMMDAKKALTEAGGDAEAATQILREKGLSKAAKRSDRDNADGAVAIAQDGNKAAIVLLKSETDFSAKSEDFVAVAQKLAELALAGEDAAAACATDIEDLKLSKKENIEVGSIDIVEAGEGNLLDTYLHRQDGRGTIGIAVEGAGVDAEALHSIALHCAVFNPRYLERAEVSEEDVEKERAALLEITKSEGKPEAAWDKIVEGRLTAWYKESVLLEQGLNGDKVSVAETAAPGTVVRFVQTRIG